MLNTLRESSMPSRQADPGLDKVYLQLQRRRRKLLGSCPHFQGGALWGQNHRHQSG